MFCHQNLIVYQRTIEFLTSLSGVIESFPSGQSDLFNQLRRAAYSIALNIAEGAGKTGANDKKRFYSIARGSTLECAAVFDIIRVMNLASKNVTSQSLKQLEEIAAMLGALVTTSPPLSK